MKAKKSHDQARKSNAVPNDTQTPSGKDGGRVGAPMRERKMPTVPNTTGGSHE